MAFGRSGGALVSAPRLATVAVSLALVGLALASLRFPLPSVLHFVGPHRLAIAVAGYAALLLGVMLRRF